MKLKIFTILAIAMIAHSAQGCTEYDYDLGIYYTLMSEQDRTAAIECGDPNIAYGAPAFVKSAEDDEFQTWGHEYYIWIGNSYSGNVNIPRELTLSLSRNYTAVVREIHRGAFCNCQALESVTIPETIYYIGPGAFYRCVSLSEIEIPSSVTEVESITFQDCHRLKKVKFSKNCDLINTRTFWQAGSMIPEFTISGVDNVTRIGHEAFQYSTLTEYPNWDKLTRIGDFAFDGTHLEHVRIPAGCTLGTNVFNNIAQLKSIELPSDCPDNIDTQFQKSPSIMQIRIEAVTPPALSADWASTLSPDCVLEVPAESIELYRSAPYWKEFGTIRAITSGVDDVAVGETAAKGLKGAISVSGNNAISIYDMHGTCIYQGTGGEIAAAPGIYIVKMPNASIKVQVQ